MKLPSSFRTFLRVLSEASIINSYFILSEISKKLFKFSFFINSVTLSFISSSKMGFFPLNYLRSVSTDPVSSNFQEFYRPAFCLCLSLSWFQFLFFLLVLTQLLCIWLNLKLLIKIFFPSIFFSIIFSNFFYIVYI